MKFKKYINYFITICKLTFHHVKFNYNVSGNQFYIRNCGEIILLKRVRLNSYPDGSCHRTALSTYFKESEIFVGNNCQLNGTVIHCNEKVSIGNYCMFGPGTIICDNNSHKVVIDPKDRRTKPESAPIIIEDNVWVGMNCLIMKGVRIGKNSIIAANSLVLKNVESNCLYGGQPARFIKKLE